MPTAAPTMENFCAGLGGVVVAMVAVGTVDRDTDNDNDDSFNTLKPESMYRLLLAWERMEIHF